MTSALAFNSYKRYLLISNLVQSRLDASNPCPHHPLTKTRYKAGTRAFSSWLAETAKTCGTSVDKIVNKTTVKDPGEISYDYLIGVQHFTWPAQAIVSSTTRVI